MIIFRKPYVAAPTTSERLWEVQRHLEMLTDDLNAAMSDIQKQIDGLSARVAKLEKQIDGLSARVAKLEEQNG